MKKKKTLLIVLVIAFGLVLLYCGVWLFYRQFVWMPHVRNCRELDDVEKEGFFGVSYLTDFDENYNKFGVILPSLGLFDCKCTAVSSMKVDKSTGVQEADGSIGYQTVNASGSAFDYLMVADFGLNGKIKCYKFVVNVMPPQKQYHEAALFVTDENAELLEPENELSEIELTLYHDAKAEMLEYIKKAKELFNI